MTDRATTLTPDEIRQAESFPPAISAYSEGYALGRLHSIARIADCSVWASYGPYGMGYRHGWLVGGRPV